MGIAKDMPAVTFILLIPIASPSRFTRGPPEFPKVIAASVWMYFMSRPLSPSSLESRCVELTTPAVTVLFRDSGEPRATTHSPDFKVELCPSLIGVKSLHLIRTVARSETVKEGNSFKIRSIAGSHLSFTCIHFLDDSGKYSSVV